MTQIKTAERNNKIKELAKNGKTATEISEIIGIKRKRVLQLLRSFRIKPKRDLHPLQIRSEKAQNIINELKNGTKQSDIARKYNVTRQYVSQIKYKLESK